MYNTMLFRNSALYKKKFNRKFPIIGQIRDADLGLWNVRDVRGTKHGFNLFFGNRDSDGEFPGGMPRLILTKELRDFWLNNKLRGDGFLFDLPAGRTTMKRARSKAGMNFLDDRTEFWMDRIEDLKSMPISEFVAVHHVKKLVAWDWRNKILGKTARDHGWWRTPETREVLLSGWTLIRMARELGISTSHAFRLRHLATEEAAAIANGLPTLPKPKRIPRETARDQGWWRAPEVREVLLSSLNFDSIGEKLGIAPSYACHLRLRTREEIAANQQPAAN